MAAHKSVANYTVTEAAAMFKTKPSNVYNWIQKGDLKTTKVDGKMMLNKRLINGMVERGEGPKSGKPRKAKSSASRQIATPDDIPASSKSPVRNTAGFDRKGMSLFPLPTNGSAELVMDLSKLCLKHGLTNVRDGVDYIEHAVST